MGAELGRLWVSCGGVWRIMYALEAELGKLCGEEVDQSLGLSLHLHLHPLHAACDSGNYYHYYHIMIIIMEQEKSYPL